MPVNWRIGAEAARALGQRNLEKYTMKCLQNAKKMKLQTGFLTVKNNLRLYTDLDNEVIYSGNKETKAETEVSNVLTLQQHLDTSFETMKPAFLKA